MNGQISGSNRISLHQVRDLALENSVAKLYDDKLPYHNFGHVQDTLEAADKIIERCHQERIRVVTKVVYYALLFHDAGYHHDHAQLGYESKEAYSAALAEQHTCDSGLTNKERLKISAAVMATHRNGVFVSVEQKLVRAADLAGLAAPYEIFLNNTVQLWIEHQMLNGPASWRAWQKSVSETLGFYLSQQIRLTSYYCNNDGASTFHLAVESNLKRFLEEPAPSEPSRHPSGLQ